MANATLDCHYVGDDTTKIICNGTLFAEPEKPLTYQDEWFWIYIGIYVVLVLFAGEPARILKCSRLTSQVAFSIQPSWLYRFNGYRTMNTIETDTGVERCPGSVLFNSILKLLIMLINRHPISKEISLKFQVRLKYICVYTFYFIYPITTKFLHSKTAQLWLGMGKISLWLDLFF